MYVFFLKEVNYHSFLEEFRTINLFTIAFKHFLNNFDIVSNCNFRDPQYSTEVANVMYFIQHDILFQINISNL